MYAAFGMSPAGIEKMFEPVLSKDDGDLHRSTQRLFHLGNGIQNEQLLAGPNLEQLTTIYLDHIEKQLNHANIPSSCIIQTHPEGTLVSLWSWSKVTLGMATIQAYFGETLLRLAPNLLDDFHTFDTNSWMLTYGYPRPFAKTMYGAIDRCIDAFTRYFELPAEERREACHYIQAVESKQRRADMTGRDIAIAGLTFFWA